MDSCDGLVEDLLRFCGVEVPPVPLGPLTAALDVTVDYTRECPSDIFGGIFVGATQSLMRLNVEEYARDGSYRSPIDVRMTAFHELGHLLDTGSAGGEHFSIECPSIGMPNNEREATADTIGRALLLPASWFTHAWNDLGDASLLYGTFYAPVAVILLRAQELGLRRLFAANQN